MLDRLLQLVAVNLVDVVHLLECLGARHQRLLVPDDIAVVWARISDVDVQINFR